jgi:hypothetical protein
VNRSGERERERRAREKEGRERMRILPHFKCINNKLGFS